MWETLAGLLVALILLRFLKKNTCVIAHDYLWSHNLYGDQVIMECGRSVWVCSRCN